MKKILQIISIILIGISTIGFSFIPIGLELKIEKKKEQIVNYQNKKHKISDGIRDLQYYHSKAENLTAFYQLATILHNQNFYQETLNKDKINDEYIRAISSYQGDSIINDLFGSSKEYLKQVREIANNLVKYELGGNESNILVSDSIEFNVAMSDFYKTLDYQNRKINTERIQVGKEVIELEKQKKLSWTIFIIIQSVGILFGLLSQVVKDKSQ